MHDFGNDMFANFKFSLFESGTKSLKERITVIFRKFLAICRFVSFVAVEKKKGREMQGILQDVLLNILSSIIIKLSEG